jgi:hypothetical protein
MNLIAKQHLRSLCDRRLMSGLMISGDIAELRHGLRFGSFF